MHDLLSRIDAYLAFAAALINFVFIILVAARTSLTSVYLTFMLTCAAAMTWTFGDFMVYATGNRFWFYFSLLGTGMAPAFMFHFVCALVRSAGHKTWIILVYTASAALALSSPLALFYPLIKGFVDGPYWNIVYFAVLVPFFLWGIVLVFRAIKGSQSEDDRSRLLYVLAAAGIAVFTGLTDLVQVLRIPLPPLGHLGCVVYSSVLAVGVFKHRQAYDILAETLRDSEEKYRAIAETATEAIITIDEMSRIVFANRSVERMFGYRPEEILGREITMLMPARLRESHMSGIARFIRHGTMKVRWEAMEFPGLHRDGHEIPLEISYGVFAKEGRHYFTGYVRDVTERRQAEKEKEYKDMLERFNRDLETLVSERTMSLMALKLADRVRNPAAVIGWTGKRILERGDHSEQCRKGLEDIVAEAAHLEVAVKEFQDLLRERKSVFTFEDVNEIVKVVLPIAERLTAEKGVALVVNLSAEPLRINAQRNLLRMVVFHLMTNAVEATPEGGRITVETSGEPGKVVLTISDTGSGIPPGVADRIFDPFFSTKAQRFGLGLPLIKQIVTEHLGDIEVESEEGRGTTFRLVFPATWMSKAESTLKGQAPTDSPSAGG
jgi:PAS domain S-box-containing protein